MSDEKLPTLYTIGHSNHEMAHFQELLQQHSIEAICDVRSHPYSQYCGHFNREPLEAALRSAGVRYAYLGQELGARTDDPSCYCDGRVVYSRLADTALFQAGIRRVSRAMAAHRVALMCAEKDPITCHRAILICRQMRSSTSNIMHILDGGEIETQQAAERRLMDSLGIVYPDLFNTEEELIEQAYERQGERIAYALPAVTR